jgi:hypothetical protein
MHLRAKLDLHNVEYILIVLKKMISENWWEFSFEKISNLF